MGVLDLPPGKRLRLAAASFESAKWAWYQIPTGVPMYSREIGALLLQRDQSVLGLDSHRASNHLSVAATESLLCVGTPNTKVFEEVPLVTILAFGGLQRADKCIKNRRLCRQATGPLQQPSKEAIIEQISYAIKNEELRLDYLEAELAKVAVKGEGDIDSQTLHHREAYGVRK